MSTRPQPNPFHAYRRPLIVSLATVGAGFFVFFFVTMSMVSAYHGVVAAAATVLAVLVLSGVYYALLFVESAGAGTMFGPAARQVLVPFRSTWSFCEVLITR